MSAHYFLATALPPLDEPGTAPPLSLIELRAAVSGSSAAPLVDVILLEDDLRQRQATLVGELSDATPAVLDPDQLAGSAPLPDFLVDTESLEDLRPADDRLWENYWRHAAAVARRRGSAFLRAWVGAEVAFRNGTAAVRARSFNQPAVAHVVAPELGADGPLIELGVAEWAGAADPLAGLRSLLRTRWDWVTRAEPRFSFGDDEIAAYAIKLVLLRDWQRTMAVPRHNAAVLERSRPEAARAYTTAGVA